jgi:hypothetical protein
MSARPAARQVAPPSVLLATPVPEAPPE